MNKPTGSTKRIRKKIKAWCRYWHFNVFGLVSDNEGHKNYLDVTRTLDWWHDTDCWNNDNATLEEAWPTVLANINKCSDEQILELERHCNSGQKI